MVVTSNWLLHPVTWKSGTETRLRTGVPGSSPMAAHAVLAVGQEVLVGGHRPLGEPRGAAGVKDGREIRRHRPVLDHRVGVGQCLARAEHIGRARVAEDVVDLGLGEPSVHGHRHRPGQLGAEEGQDPVRSVGKEDGDPVTTSDTGRLQAPGHPGGPVLELLVGEAIAADFDGRLAVAVARHRRLQHGHNGRLQAGVPEDPAGITLDAVHLVRLHLSDPTLLLDPALLFDPSLLFDPTLLFDHCAHPQRGETYARRTASHASQGEPQPMPTVNTVRGPIDTSQLGRVLMHEHIFVLSPEFVMNYPEHDGFDEAVEVPKAVTRLNELKAAGIDTIVDPTVIGLGRYLPRIERVNAEADINVVAATGLYTYGDVPHYLHFRGPGTVLDGEEPLVQMFVDDITTGIAGTSVKAAFLKCATDEPGVTPGVERVLRAVAQAHRATGAPITTHSHAVTRRGLEQQDIFESEGVDLSRVVIGHSGDTTDLDYLEELMARGSFIGMDRFGIDLEVSFEDRVATVAALCERGHADQMVLSHDASCYIDWLPMDQLPVVLPNWNFLHISRNVIPALKERGVTDEQIDQMLVDNPRRYFESPLGAY